MPILPPLMLPGVQWSNWSKHICPNSDFSEYFREIEAKSERLDWLKSPFFVSESNNNLPARLQEHLMDLSSNHRYCWMGETLAIVRRERERDGRYHRTGGGRSSPLGRGRTDACSSPSPATKQLTLKMSIVGLS